MPRPCILLAAALVLLAGCALRPRGAGGPDAPAPTPAAGAVSFTTDEYWRRPGITFTARCDLAQPVVALPGGGWAYAGRRDLGKLVLDLYATSKARLPGAPEPPGTSLANAIDSVQVFTSDRQRPIATIRRRDIAYVRGTAETFEHGRSGRLIATVERWRIPFGEHAAAVRDRHPYLLTLVARDAQGLTVACEDIAGDEAVEPFAPAPPLAR